MSFVVSIGVTYFATSFSLQDIFVNGQTDFPMVAVFPKVLPPSSMCAKVVFQTSVAVCMNTVCPVVSIQTRYNDEEP